MTKITKEIEKISRLSDPKLQKYFDNEPLKFLHQMKLYADDKYYNSGQTSGLTNDQYDMLKDTLKSRDPDYVPPIGTKIRHGENRTQLPFWLGSMNKYKMTSEYLDLSVKELKDRIKKLSQNMSTDDKALVVKIRKHLTELTHMQRWLERHQEPYVIEDKLDGVSCLLTSRQGELKIYTRGDGIVGSDISYLAQYFRTIPQNLPDINVRGELIIPKDVFNQKYSQYANARNLVAGRTGAKTIKDGMQDIQFVAYEIVGEGLMPRPTDQFATLKKLGFIVVRHKIIALRPITSAPKLLAKILIKWKEESKYDIDGIIVQANQPYQRNVDSNPTYAFAFKMSLTFIKATVVQVVWGITRWAQLKPRVQIVPVKLMGSTITFATGKNAKFIVNNKIGPGAIVKITKGGDVIPDIIGIIEKASNPQMPLHPCEWEWNATHVDIVATNHKCGNICIQLMKWFFHDLRFKHIGIATVTKLYKNGLDSILKILIANKQQIRQAGFGAGETEVIYKSIKSTLGNGLDLAQTLAASGVMGNGIGHKSIDKLLEAYPKILEEQKDLSREKLETMITKVEGFGRITSAMAARNLPWAAKFATIMALLTSFHKRKRPATSGPLTGYTVIISGSLTKNGIRYSKKQAAEAVLTAGGKISDSVRKPSASLKQVVVIVKKGTGKDKKAAKYGIPTYSNKEFFRVLKEGPFK